MKTTSIIHCNGVWRGYEWYVMDGDNTIEQNRGGVGMYQVRCECMEFVLPSTISCMHDV